MRVEYAGAIYHVTIRGNNRRMLFVDDEDRERFIDRLGEYRAEYGIRVYAFCLMANHYTWWWRLRMATWGGFCIGWRRPTRGISIFGMGRAAT